MDNQIEKWRDRGRQIQYKLLNENWIVGIFDGMNELWCDLWEFRLTELKSSDMAQLNKVLKITEKYSDKYEEWAKKTIPEVKDILLKGLDLTDAKNFDKMLDVAFKLT
jgi:hypothetical protein